MRSTNQARFHCSYNITREKHHLFIKNPQRQPCLTWALTSNKLDVIDGYSTQEQSNQPEKDSIQDQNLNINDNKHEQHEQSTRAPGIINPTEEEVTKVTRWYLKCEQEGTLDLYTRVVNSGIVGGKL